MSTPRPLETSTEAPAGPSRRSGLVVAIAVMVIAVTGVLAIRHYFQPSSSAPAATGRIGDEVAIGGPFTLTDHHGNIVTDGDFRGRYLLVYFGFTYCPDVCPTSLVRNAEAMQRLDERSAAQIQPILITVDPERDTPELLAGYVGFFDERLVGLTGTPEQIKAVADAYRVYYAKAVPEGTPAEDYLVDHSAFTYLMGPDGRFIRFFRHDLSADEMAEQLRAALDRHSTS